MTPRDHVLRAVSGLTPGQRDAFTWMILALVVTCGAGIVGVVLRLEAGLR